MATVQRQLHKFALSVALTTKKGFKFNDATAALTISGATNASPIVITTTTNHGLVTGQQVYIASVGGNTAANSTASNPNWTITRVNATTFSLDGSTGNGAYTSGGTATAELIGSVDPASMPRQRLLDIYNMARLALFQVLEANMEKQRLGRECGALTTSISNFSFTLASTVSTATKPTGYIDFVSLSNTTDVPIVLLNNQNGMTQHELINSVRYGTNLDFKQSATNMFVFDIGTQLVSYGTVGVNSGNSYLTTASTYKLVYYGISEFTLTDVLGNSTAETYNEKYHQLLLEMAQAIYEEQGNERANALALKFLGRG